VSDYGIEHIHATEVSMSTSLEVLEAEVLQLAPADRSRLFERLIASLDLDADVEQAWDEVADRRERELDAGTALMVPAPEAIARLRQRLSQ
jgi:hypothetical protein